MNLLMFLMDKGGRFVFDVKRRFRTTWLQGPQATLSRRARRQLLFLLPAAGAMATSTQPQPRDGNAPC